MPNFYSLTPKGGTAPETLIAVDEKMCAHFGVEPHPKNWYFDWENTVGLGFAVGQSFEQLRVIFTGCTEELAILAWLEEHYTVQSWASAGGMR